MKVISLTDKNFTVDVSRQKKGSQEGWWGRLKIGCVKKYGLVKLDTDGFTRGARFYALSFYELLFSQLAKAFKLKVAHYYPIIANWRGDKINGVFTPSFLNKNEILEDYYYAFKRYRFPFVEENFSLEDYSGLFNKLKNGRRLEEDFILNLFYNLTIMNTDFSCAENMPLVRNKIRFSYRAAPLYDLSAVWLQGTKTTSEQLPSHIDKWQKESLYYCFNLFPKDTITESAFLILSKRYPKFACRYYRNILNAIKSKKVKHIFDKLKSLNLTDTNTFSCARIYTDACLKAATNSILNALSNKH